MSRPAIQTSNVIQQDNSYAASLSIDELGDMVSDSVVEAADGCIVEPDGSCPHFHRSPLLVLGMI